MKILIVEDNQSKLDHITNFIRSKFDNSFVSNRRSFQTGLKEIQDVTYDIILLDMSMPTYDISPTEAGGAKKTFAGMDILRQMQRKGITTPVLIVTQFDIFGDGENSILLTELKSQLSEKFPAIYLGTVYYNTGVSWESELENYLSKLNQ
jgi:CheY-like chemotaxis protein